MTDTPAAGSHPCLISYGATHKASIPLVLIVGREPNGSGVISSAWGPYDFRDRPYCGFWNVAYGLMGTASSPSISTGQFKQLAEARGASPLIIADAMPQSINNVVQNKNVIRAKHSDQVIREHVGNIFSHELFIERVRCVLFSGLTEIFGLSIRLFEEHCTRRRIPFQHLPFFTATNVPQIREVLSAETWATLRLVAAELAAYPASK